MEDLAFFLREMAGVEKLGGKAENAPSGAPPPPLVRWLDEEEKLLFLSAVGEMDIRRLPSDDEEEAPPPLSRMRRLKRGDIRISLELDLHGLTRDEALEALSRFIPGARRRGQEAVLVITGKGNNSPGEPVLQGAVDAWLRAKGKDAVAEFHPAPGRMGGSGAFVVFLKGAE